MPSIALPVSLRGQLLSGTRSPAVAFSPASLFSANEPGVWYDPSDVANLAWRRNLLTYSEQFDNAAWSVSGGAVSANAATAPDGTTTADVLTPNTSAARHYVRQGALFPGYALSVYAKANVGALNLWLGDSAVGARVYFDLTNGTIASGSGATIQAVGNGWYRCSILNVTSGGVSAANQPWIGASVGTDQFAASNGTDSILLWGAQLELGSVATDYQRISDVNTEVIERFPSATLFQDPAGTTPVTTPGQTVGLMLDKSKGLALGPELVVNGDFSGGTTGWVAGFGTTTSTLTISGGAGLLTVASPDTTPRYGRAITGLTVGKFYRIDCDTFSVSGAGDKYFGWTSLSNLTGGESWLSIWTTPRYYQATATTMYVWFGFNGSAAGATITIDNISVRELPGNHATQATLASRPIYGIEPVGGRRNLLTWSEDFTNAVWGVSRATKGAAQLDPNGGMTAIRITATSANGDLAQSISAANVTHANSVWLRRVSGTGDIQLGTPANGTITMAVTSSWQRFSTSGLPVSGTTAYLLIRILTSGDVIDVAFAQQELGSTASAYQRTTTQYDVTEAGVASTSYLAFDGVDDGMVTGTITPGVDKAQIFAGVRKLSDAASGALVEFGNLATDNGGIAFNAPNTLFGLHYRWSLRNNAGGVTDIGPSTGYAAPISNVLTGIADISGDRSTLRINGTQVAQSTADQGTGNFLAYPLYIGRRGGSSLPFKGNVYSLITRFGANLDAGVITSTEIWVGDKTGIDVAKNISTTIYTRSGDTILDRANSIIERRAV